MQRAALIIFLALAGLPQQARAECPVALDLFRLHHYSYRVTKYDVAMEILNHYRPHIRLADVAVGVYDMGFYPHSEVRGEFLRERYTCRYFFDQ